MADRSPRAEATGSPQLYGEGHTWRIHDLADGTYLDHGER
jgi:hypothetical protein